jgi:hypothetical protein
MSVCPTIVAVNGVRSARLAPRSPGNFRRLESADVRTDLDGRDALPAPVALADPERLGRPDVPTMQPFLRSWRLDVNFRVT